MAPSAMAAFLVPVVRNLDSGEDFRQSLLQPDHHDMRRSDVVGLDHPSLGPVVLGNRVATHAFRGRVVKGTHCAPSTMDMTISPYFY